MPNTGSGVRCGRCACPRLEDGPSPLRGPSAAQRVWRNARRARDDGLSPIAITGSIPPGAGAHCSRRNIVRQQRFDVAQFVGQIGELAEHRLKLLLVARRLHHIAAITSRSFAATAARCVVRTAQTRRPPAVADPAIFVGQIDLIARRGLRDRRRRRAASGLLAGRAPRSWPTRLEPGFVVGPFARMALLRPARSSPWRGQSPPDAPSCLASSGDRHPVRHCPPDPPLRLAISFGRIGSVTAPDLPAHDSATAALVDLGHYPAPPK